MENTKTRGRPAPRHPCDTAVKEGSTVTANVDKLTLLEAAALLSGSSEWDSRPLPARGIPSFVMSDGPHGIRRQLGAGDHLGIAASEPSTCFPTAATVANSWEPALAERMGEALGQEARALGVDVVLGPGLNIKRSPLCGRNFEYYSEDPILAGRMASGLVRGIQSQGVAATPKHFAVNSQELRRMASDSVVDERTMREVYLTGFEIVVREAAPKALMTSYNKVNGVYAHENAHLLRDILRSEWGFDGLVVSDWGGSNSAPAAAAAGGALEMPAPGLHSVREIVAAVEAGEISEEDVRARAAEVARMAAMAPSASGAARPEIEVDAHHALAREVSRRSIVLLKNEGGALPLASGVSVALIGDMAKTPRYQGSGSSQVNPTRLETLLESMEDTDLHLVGWAKGYDRLGEPAPHLIDEAVALARRADVVVLAIGLDELSESEGLDRSHMRIPQVQVELLEAIGEVSDNIVVVLSAGSSIETPWSDKARAIVHTCLSGQAGASATWEVLTGAVNPSGHLAETWPQRLEDHPTHGIAPSPGPLALYREGPYVGYRYFATTGVPVAFPFGHGLSYSTFEYSDLVVDAQGVTLTVTNTSGRDGDEVVQLYVRRPGVVWGPTVELKGFTKVHVPAGAAVEVAIPFDDYTFRHFDTSTDSWSVEAGKWTLMVGRSVEDLPLKVEHEVEGEHPLRRPMPDCYRTGRVAKVDDEDFAALLGRPVPAEADAGELTTDDPISAMSHARSRIARAVARVLERQRKKADATGKPDLNILFITNMPFRALGKMTKGAVSTETVDGILDLVNGHPLRGTRRTVSALLRNRRANKATQRDIDSAAN